MSLKHYIPALSCRLIEIFGYICDVRSNLFAVFFEPVHNLISIYRLVTVAFDCDVFPFHDILNLFVKAVHIKQILHAQSFFHILVCIDRSYASAGRAEFLVCQSVLFHNIHKSMIRQTYNCLVAYLEIVGSYFNALLSQLAGLVYKVFDIYYHTVPHYIHSGFSENS